MSQFPNCPECQSDLTYLDGALYVCPMCGHEWSEIDEADLSQKTRTYRDVHGNELNDGDDITVIKDLKVKGAKEVVKQGTIVKDIRLIDEDHDIDCKVPGIGPMKLKSEFVKKL